MAASKTHDACLIKEDRKKIEHRQELWRVEMAGRMRKISGTNERSHTTTDALFHYCTTILILMTYFNVPAPILNLTSHKPGAA